MTGKTARQGGEILLVLCLLAALGACDDRGGGDADGDADVDADADADTPVTPVELDPTDFTYLLEESPEALPLWATPATRRVRTADRPPEATRSGLTLSAARREFEPAQLVLGPSTGSATVEVAPFPDLGAGQRLELAEVGFVDGWAERLTPLASGGSVALSPDSGTPLWLTVRVPDDAPPGEHATTLTVTPAGGDPIAVPISLYVFDFAIPEELHFDTQINVSVSSLLGGGTVDDAKTLLFELRMTPTSATWPSGFGWGITWENASSSSPCEVLWDEPDEGAEYSIGQLARRYLLGEGWNGVGFSDSEIFQFVDNSTPRPDTFCGLSRGDHHGTSEYNAEWSQWLAALDGYLVENGYADRVYYYVQNEPQDAEDEALAAHLCRLTRAAAPDLRIAISEEPKPSIAEDPGGACGYDIWIAHVRAYQQDYAWARQRDFGEEVWLYSLDHDPDPYFNPTRVEGDGMHERIIPWVSWGLRATGWAYYDGGRFFETDSPRPTVRGALLREGFEDFEYLWLANGGALPRVFADEAVDRTARSVASGLTSWSHDPDAVMALRHELGLYIEGSREALPVLEAETGARPRGAYYLNFQDPAGPPTADPLVVGGRTYLKVGWGAYDDTRDLGWSGEHIDDPGIALYGYDDVAGYDDVQRSYVYDDYGRDNLFEFALENGRYEVTIGVGRPARGYPGDPHNATIEGIPVVDDEVTTDAEPQLRRTVTVDLTDGSLSLVVGGLSETTGAYAYTFLAYLEIEPVD
jgi:hypothetical protein